MFCGGSVGVIMKKFLHRMIVLQYDVRANLKKFLTQRSYLLSARYHSRSTFSEVGRIHNHSRKPSSSYFGGAPDVREQVRAKIQALADSVKGIILSTGTVYRILVPSCFSTTLENKDSSTFDQLHAPVSSE